MKTLGTKLHAELLYVQHALSCRGGKFLYHFFHYVCDRVLENNPNCMSSFKIRTMSKNFIRCTKGSEHKSHV